MKKQNLRKIFGAVSFLSAFLVWTVAVCLVDVQPIGPKGTCVGFATINALFHDLTGTHMALYTITDWLSLIPLGFVLGFALLGLVQWVERKNLFRVDRSIFGLGIYYIVVLAMFVLFEMLVVNYRPILIEGRLEASYPSSTTMLVICVMATAVMQLKTRIAHKTLQRYVCLSITLFGALMVVGRLVSGVHWFSDIIGGGLLSTGLVLLYKALCDPQENM